MSARGGEKRERPPLETGLLREKENEVLGSVKKKRERNKKLKNSQPHNTKTSPPIQGTS